MSVNWSPLQNLVSECPHADRPRDNWLLTDGALWLLCDDCRAQCERELRATNRVAQRAQLHDWQGRHEVN